MFTGIITELAEVVSLRRSGDAAVLKVKAPIAAADAEVGDSIAHNGVCLTVTVIDRSGVMSYDLSGETLDSSNLGKFTPGDRVNIETSLRPDGKLGGHFVSGHVDGVGRITEKRKDGDMLMFRIEAPELVTQYLVEKGSITVDGISLTVVDIGDDFFTLVIIPHTAKLTTLGFKGKGDSVNLEADIIGKYVFRFMQKQGGAPGAKSGSLMSKLMEEGFV